MLVMTVVGLLVVSTVRFPACSTHNRETISQRIDHTPIVYSCIDDLKVIS